MNVLITNIWLCDHAGTEVYVRDLAIALKKRGIQVEVYSPRLGKVADEIKKAGIQVTDRLENLSCTPDIIHAHHFESALEVLHCFQDTPAVFFLHDRVHPMEIPPKHSQIMKYLATDYNTLDRLIIDEAIPKAHTAVLFNWVDTRRFQLKQHWAEKPKKALLFSNYASENNYLPAVRAACKKLGIELSCIGLSNGTEVMNPEMELGKYDIVFAKAKAAMEAMATGAAVIACDYRGLGKIVTTKNYSYYRKNNFGMKILNRPITEELLVEEIKQYDPADAKQVTLLIREEADMQQYIDNLLGYYHEAIERYRTGTRIFDPSELNTIQTFENPQQVVINRVDEKVKSVNQLLSVRLVNQQKRINELEANLEVLKTSVVQRSFRWVKRKIQKN